MLFQFLQEIVQTPSCTSTCFTFCFHLPILPQKLTHIQRHTLYSSQPLLFPPLGLWTCSSFAQVSSSLPLAKLFIFPDSLLIQSLMCGPLRHPEISWFSEFSQNMVTLIKHPLALWLLVCRHLSSLDWETLEGKSFNRMHTQQIFFE